MFNVNNIIKDSVVDGAGVRTTVFFQGCSHHCKGCHNPESWNHKAVKNRYTVSELVELIEVDNFTKCVTLSGGEPFEQNLVELLALVHELKKLNYNIWIYSGYTLHEIKELGFEATIITKIVDVIVDGKYIESKNDPSTSFKGSTNQKINYLK